MVRQKILVKSVRKVEVGTALSPPHTIKREPACSLLAPVGPVVEDSDVSEHDVDPSLAMDVGLRMTRAVKKRWLAETAVEDADQELQAATEIMARACQGKARAMRQLADAKRQVESLEHELADLYRHGAPNNEEEEESSEEEEEEEEEEESEEESEEDRTNKRTRNK